MLNHFALKGVAIVCLFLLTTFTGLLPLRIGNGGHSINTVRRQKILSCLNCFAGGVFLATCLLDLLPMIREKFAEAFSLAKISTVFPVAEFATCVGFFFILIIEQIVHTLQEGSLFLGHSHESKTPLLQDSITSGETEGGYTRDTFATPSTSTHDSSFSSTLRSRRNRTQSNLRTYILVLALAMHSVFEGLALGLITEMDRLTQIAVAIVIHKSIIAFSLGVNLVQHELPVGAIVKSILIFSAMAPIGIGLGILVLRSATVQSSSLASGILQGVACGTFLFVTFFEIFQKELSERGNRLGKVLSMLLGFSVVTGLLYYANILEHKSHDVHPRVTNSSIANSTGHFVTNSSVLNFH